jgi:CCR4-NOT transcription complex subunit 3
MANVSPFCCAGVCYIQQMEKFKAVEKEMKTKAYSKEGLLASARLDPKAQQKQDMVSFLSECTGELDRQIEACEAEAESLAVTLKKGKKADSARAERVAEVERIVERHKWHQGKLELIMRLIENGQLEIEQVERIKEEIKWYVDSNQDVDFNADEDENIYDELNLDEEIAEEVFGMGLDGDRMSSQDATSQQDDVSEHPVLSKGKDVTGRRPSTHLRSPLAAMPHLHTSHSTSSFGQGTGTASVKPATLPARPAGGIEYARVATAAAAAEKNVGIAPLPPPPGQASMQTPAIAPLPPVRQHIHHPIQRQTSSSSSTPIPAEKPKAPVPQTIASSPRVTNVRLPSPGAPPEGPLPDIPQELSQSIESDSGLPSVQTESQPSDTETSSGSDSPNFNNELAQDECTFHLPPGLQDLMSSFEATKKRIVPNPPDLNRSLELSYLNAPDSQDAEKPKHYKPTQKYNTPAHYPQEPLPIFDDPSLYKRVDTDTLFYVFYYRQGTYQQYLSAKELKRQSWRFHKQYQTWFQRHEEPKTITEDYEQGTYRFFDYESTWFATYLDRHL